jgi:hypothetical protein
MAAAEAQRLEDTASLRRDLLMPSEDRRDEEQRPTCAHDGCDTILSRYNKTDRCGVHAPWLESP